MCDQSELEPTNSNTGHPANPTTAVTDDISVTENVIALKILPSLHREPQPSVAKEWKNSRKKPSQMNAAMPC